MEPLEGRALLTGVPTTLSFFVTPSVAEGQPATVTLTLSVPIEGFGTVGQVDVTYTTLPGSATPTADYTPVSGSISFSPLQTQATFTVDTLDDLLVEGDETFTVELTSVTGAEPPGENTRTVTILDNDGLPSSVTADDQSLSLPQDTSAALTLTATDTENDPLTYTLASQPQFGTLSGTAPNLVYTPSPGYFGSDSFTFTASDGVNVSNVATVSLTVTEVVSSITADDQSLSTQQEVPVAITLFATDTENDPLTYSIANQPQNGWLSGDAPNLIYTPNLGFYGYDSFTFTATDGVHVSNVATVSLAVSYSAVTAYDQWATTQQEVPVGLTLYAIDTEWWDPLTYTLLTQPQNGTLSGWGQYLTYTPNPGFYGSDYFNYTATDGVHVSNVANVYLNVAYSVVTASDQSLTTQEDQSVGITLYATDTEFNWLTYEIVTPPQNGTLSGWGQFLTYTPNLNFYGPDSFTFTATDGVHVSNVATVSLTVTPDPTIIAFDQWRSLPQDSWTEVTLSASDAQGDPLYYTITSYPYGGTLQGTAPNLVYIPWSGYVGSDSFSFAANDGYHFSNTATVYLNVTYSVVTADSQQLTTPEDTPLPLTLTASDTENDPLTYTIVTYPQYGSLSGDAPNLIYTPNPDYFGPDSFTFTASDGVHISQPATVAIEVAMNPDDVSAYDQWREVSQDATLEITLMATDNEGNPLTYAIISQPQFGALTGTAPNLVYTPNANYLGFDSFTFTATDGVHVSNTATIAIEVFESQVTAVEQSVATTSDTPVNVTLSGMDTEDDPLTFTVASQPEHGAITGTAPNLVYTPATDFVGYDQFIFTASDGVRESAPATVWISVSQGVSNVRAFDQERTTVAGVAIPVTLFAADEDRDSLTYTVVAQPQYGSLAGTAPHLIYTPSANFVGEDVFTFVASDGTHMSNTAAVTIEVVADASTVAALDLNFFTFAETALPLTLQGVDSENDSLTFFVASPPVNGVLTGAAPNLIYTPAPGYVGVDTFTYVASDGAHSSYPATVAIDVQDGAPSSTGNRAPVFRLPEYEFELDGDALIGQVIGIVSAIDPDTGDTLTYTLDGSIDYLTIDSSTGVITLTAYPQLPDDSTMTIATTVTVSDGQAADTKPVQIVVNPWRPIVAIVAAQGPEFVSFTTERKEETAVEMGFTVYLHNGPARRDVTANFIFAGQPAPGVAAARGYATLNQDFTSTYTASVTIPAGEKSRTSVISVLPDRLVEGDERIIVQLIGGVDYDVFRDGLTQLWIVDNDRWEWQAPQANEGHPISTDGAVAGAPVDPEIGDWGFERYDVFRGRWAGDSEFRGSYQYSASKNGLIAGVVADWEWGSQGLFQFPTWKVDTLATRANISFSHDKATGNITINSGSGVSQVLGLPAKVGPASVHTGYQYTIDNSDPYTKTVTLTVNLLAQISGTVTYKSSNTIGVGGKIADKDIGEIGATGSYLFEYTAAASDGGEPVDVNRTFEFKVVSYEDPF